MNRLEKWLWNNCELKANGQTTGSLYFKYGFLEIRYANHVSNSSTGDLHIITSSVYDSIFYAVRVKGSAKIMIINAKDTIEFIKHQAIIKELNMPVVVWKKPPVDKIEYPETLFKVYKTKSAQANKVFTKNTEYWSNAELSNLKRAIQAYFNKTTGIGTVFNTYLKENKVNFTEAVNIYKIIAVDNNYQFSTKAMDEVLNHIRNL